MFSWDRSSREKERLTIAQPLPTKQNRLAQRATKWQLESYQCLPGMCPSGFMFPSAVVKQARDHLVSCAGIIRLCRVVGNFFGFDCLG